MNKLRKNNSGFTLVELMVAMGIFLLMFAGVSMTMTTGQDTWATADNYIELQKSVRLSVEKISKELRESGSDQAGTMKVTILDNTGNNNTDVLRFSMPVFCQVGGTIIDSNADVSHWGAPLTWGCKSSTCMDADNDCNTVEYSKVEYSIDANQQLVRKVLNSGNGTVRQEVFAQNISDFQVSLSADNNVVSLAVTVTKTSVSRRPVTFTSTNNVFLRNRG